MFKLIVLSFALCASSVALGMGNMPFQVSEQKSGGLAPEFNLETASGGGVKSLTEARDGKKTVLFFWATWCPHCRTGIAHLNERLDVLHQEGINVVLVSVGETKEEVAAYLQHNNIKLDSFVDPDNGLQESYQLIGVPTIYFIDEQGVIRNSGHEFPADYASLFN